MFNNKSLIDWIGLGWIGGSGDQIGRSCRAAAAFHAQACWPAGRLGSNLIVFYLIYFLSRFHRRIADDNILHSSTKAAEQWSSRFQQVGCSNYFLKFEASEFAAAASKQDFTPTDRAP